MAVLRDLLALYACDWLQLEFSRHQPTLPICATTSNGWLPDSLAEGMHPGGTVHHTGRRRCRNSVSGIG